MVTVQPSSVSNPCTVAVLPTVVTSSRPGTGRVSSGRHPLLPIAARATTNEAGAHPALCRRLLPGGRGRAHTATWICSPPHMRDLILHRRARLGHGGALAGSAPHRVPLRPQGGQVGVFPVAPCPGPVRVVARQPQTGRVVA